jgi:hypothetical protein
MINLRPHPNNRKVFVQIDRLEERTTRSIRQGWFKLGKDLKQTANKEILKRPKGGRTYIRRTRGGRRRRHVASAAGETHANMTGKLRRSIGWRVSGSKYMEFGYGVARGEFAPDYANAIENGSRTILARPSLRNTINSTQRNAERYFDFES